MRRVVVLGGLGLFGGAVVEQLRGLGISPLVAARRESADIQLDANDPHSVRAAFRAEDLVIDAAGPFQRRSMALLEAAVATGFDLIDINDNLSYAEQVLACESSVVQAGIRVLSSASSVSCIWACVKR